MTKASQATILSIAVPANPNIKIEAVYGFGEEDLKFLSDRGCEIIELSQSTIAAKLFTTGKQCPVIHKRLKSFEETEGEDIICPFFHDTEYLSSKITAVDDGFEHDNRMFITNQVKFFDEKEGKIYATPEFERWSFENNKPELRHPVSRKPLIIMDMLEDKGFETDIKTYTKEEKTLFEHDSKGLKTFTFQFYGFFSVVDFVALVNKKTEDGKKLFNIFSDAVAKERLTHKRRLTCGAWAKGLMLYSIITINNVKYRLKMDCVDISAASGNKSLDNVATQYGIKLPHKDLMKGGKIKRMHVVYHEEPDNYDKYALGDIDLKPIIIAMYQSLMELYSKKNVREYVPDELPLTAGKMVSHLEESKLCKDIGTILHPEIVEPKELKKFFVENYLEPSSPKSFAKLVQNNGYLLGKVIGGRCMNNFPNKHTFTGYITDMDLKGAYGVAMMNLDIPIGNPEIFESNKNTKKMTLRQWLKFVEQHSSNYWQVIVSSVDKLKHDCDFIPSFHPPQPTREIQSDDTVIGEIDFKDGTTRIYLREIYNGLINERVLDVINQLSKKHREDLLDSLVVECMVFYPNSTQVTEPEELKTKRIFKFDRRSKIGHYIHQTVGQNASWYAYPLKNIVGELQHIRNQYNKEKPDEKPMNEFAKLAVNTTYGVLVSRYFNGNVITANLITAEVRAKSWYMDKTCRGKLTITDGSPILLDECITPFKSKSRENDCFDTTKFGTIFNFSRKQLSDSKFCSFINLTKQTPYSETNDKKSRTLMDEAVGKHICNQFPNSKILNGERYTLIDKKGGKAEYEYKQSFPLESKCNAKQITIHGSANYKFTRWDDVTEYKVRSQKSSGDIYDIGMRDDKAFVENNIYYDEGEGENPLGYRPAMFMLDEIENNQSHCRLVPLAINKQILKTGTYKHQKKWQESNNKTFVGDDYHKLINLRYNKMESFRYQTKAQCDAWIKVQNRLQTKYSIGFEIFYMNEDGTLNYDEAIKELSDSTSNGKSPYEVFGDKVRYVSRHVSKNILERHKEITHLKSKLQDCLVVIDDDDCSEYEQNESTYDEID